MYSEKINFTSPPLNLSEPSSGSDAINSGGSLSSGPPLGGETAAQE